MSTPISAHLIASSRPVAEPRLAPDGTSVVFSTRAATGNQLVKIDLGDSDRLRLGPETVVGFHPSPIGVHPSGGGSFDWLPDSSGLVYCCTDGLIRVRRDGTGAVRVASSPEGASWSQPTVSRDATLVAAVEGWPDHDRIVAVSLLDGTRTEIAHAAFCLDPAWGPDGLLVWHQWDATDMPWEQSTLAAVTVGIDARIAPAPHLHSDRQPGACGQPRFAPGGSQLAQVEDSTGWMNVSVDGVPLGEHHEHATPTWGPGQRSYAWSPDAKRLVFMRNEAGFGRLCVADLDRFGSEGAATELAKAWHIGLSWSKTPKGRDRVCAVRTGGVTAPQLVVYELGVIIDAKVRRSTVARSVVGAWDALPLVEPSVFRSKVSGRDLHGLLYTPHTPTPPKGRPLIVWIHGGPTDQHLVDFNARIQLWVSKGYAVLAPNYHGSTGHGRAYQQALNGQWGVADVQDCADLLRQVSSANAIDPNAVIALGGSAGGYTALMLGMQEPDLVSAVVALYPVTDLADLDERTHRFEKAYTALLTGDPSDYASRSPLTYPERLTVPTLLLHGDADDSVPVDQSIKLAEAMRGRGADVELHVYPGEGHGWRQPATTLDECERIEAFLTRNGLVP